MYAYIKGEIGYLDPSRVILETGGIGYEIHISIFTFGEIQNMDRCKLFIHSHITDDAHRLYGFSTQDEKEVFVQLISVSGIGPNTARVILSSMSTDEVRNAIGQEDHTAFSKIKGIGPKTAKRVIIDLKDKITHFGGESTKVLDNQSNTLWDEALSALLTLGFKRNRVQKLLEEVRKNPNMTDVESIIKAALKDLS